QSWVEPADLLVDTGLAASPEPLFLAASAGLPPAGSFGLAASPARLCFFSLSDLKSVSYQPLPASRNAGAVTCRRTLWCLPQLGRRRGRDRTASAGVRTSHRNRHSGTRRWALHANLKSDPPMILLCARPRRGYMRLWACRLACACAYHARLPQGNPMPHLRSASLAVMIAAALPAAHAAAPLCPATPSPQPAAWVAHINEVNHGLGIPG